MLHATFATFISISIITIITIFWLLLSERLARLLLNHFTVAIASGSDTHTPESPILPSIPSEEYNATFNWEQPFGEPEPVEVQDTFELVLRAMVWNQLVHQACVVQAITGIKRPTKKEPIIQYILQYQDW